MRKKIFYSLLVTFVSIHVVSAQKQKVNVSSPYHTVYNHLKYLQEDSFRPKLAAQTLYTSASNKEQLAKRLKKILDANGIEIDLKTLPKNNDYFDSTENAAIYFLTDDLPSIYLEKIGDKWLYSKETVEAIPSLYEEIATLSNFFSFLGEETYFELQLWQYVSFLLVILICFFLHKLLTWLFNIALKRVLFQLGLKTVALKFIQPVSKPLSLFIITTILYILFPELQLPIKLSKYIAMAFKVIIPIYIMLVFYRLVNILTYYLRQMAERTENTLDDQLVPLVSKALKAFVVITGVLLILQNLNFNITTLLAGISIGGLAFALAAQDTIKNLFGSLMIFLDRPFQVGDWVIAPDGEGTVEEVGFRSTRIRTFSNSLISIPNGILADSAINNMGARVYRRFNTKIALTYDTPTALVELYVQGLREIVKNHPDTRKDYYEIHMNEMGDSSLNVLFYIFFKVSDWSKELKARHEIILSVIELAETLGIRFAFPTNTIHIEDFPEKKTLTPNYDKLSVEELKERMRLFLQQK